ncbi:ankyrin repeat-containing domain protein [Rhypophila decipiens]|uniref:Ankyrin repeat-containing domain protein n=1 Tax=Rhypophila decipiens TaxID=261697 RepID=A0AAN7AYR9_9PEZI|nr:ankyrin repeat-containing domain protein [Rhypophila decipiens]
MSSPSSHVIFVCGLPTLGVRPGTKGNLEQLLKARFPHSRILVFDELERAGASEFRSNWIHRMAEDMLVSLSQAILKDNQSTEIGDKNGIVFLGQNIGGWVLKQALLRAANESQFYPIITMTRGVIFFGTPHRSLEHSDWQTYLTRLFLASKNTLAGSLDVIQDAAQVIDHINHRFDAIQSSFYVTTYDTEPSLITRNKHGGDLMSDDFGSTSEPQSRHDTEPANRDIEMWNFRNFGPDPDALGPLVDGLVGDFSSVNSEYQKMFRQLLQHDAGLYQINRRPSAEGRMAWLSENLAYANFTACQTSCILNVQCEPGSGVTAFASYMMDRLRVDAGTQDCPILSFSCSTQYPRSQRADALFLSLSRQLLTTKHSLCSSIRPLFNWMVDTSLFTSADATWALFRSLIAAYPPGRPIFCFIVGFDKHDELWKGVIRDMTIHQRGESPSRVKFILANCFAANFLAETCSLRTAAGHPAGTPRQQNHLPYFTLDFAKEGELSAAAQNSVRTLLRQKSHQSHMWERYQDKIMDALFSKDISHGYSVAVLKLQLLQTPTFRSDEKEILARLALLPRYPGIQQSLKAIYKRLMAHVNQWEKQALEYVTTSVRPLTIHELSVLVALGSQQATDFNTLKQSIPCDVIQDLSGERGIRDLISLVDGRVIPVHSSLSTHLSTGDTHFAFLRSCLDYLRIIHAHLYSRPGIREGQDNNGTSISSQSRPFILELTPGSDAWDPVGCSLIAYATCHWFDHYKRCSSQDFVDQLVLDFLQDGRFLSTWFSFFLEMSDEGIWDPTLGCEAVEVAAGLGLGRMVKRLLPDAKKKLCSANQCSSGTECRCLERALTLAARNGSPETVDELLPHVQFGIEVVFGLAAEMGHVLLVDHLLNSQAPEVVAAVIDMGDDLGYTPLMRALRGGHIAVAKLLIEEDANISTVAADKTTSMHLLTRLGHLPLIQQVLDGDMARPYVGATDSEGYSCFHIAVQCGFSKIVELFLENGAQDLLVKTPVNGTAQTPLYLAATHGWYETVYVLLRNNANPRRPKLRAVDDATFSPLYAACANGFLSLVELLLSGNGLQTTTWARPDSGGDVNIMGTLSQSRLEWQGSDPEDDNSSLRQSTSSTSASRGLSAHYPEINACLRIAAQKGHGDIVHLLTEHGTGFSSDDTDTRSGETALHLAASQGQADIVEHLIGAGFNVNAITNGGVTPLQLAAKSGNAMTVLALLQRGARPNVGDLDTAQGADWQNDDDSPEEEPLELAAESGHVEVVSLLLNHGANPTKKAFDLAAERGHARVLEALIDATTVTTAPGHDAEKLKVSYMETLVKLGHAAAVDKLLTPELGIKIHTEGNVFLLHLAVRHGMATLLPILVNKGVPCDATDDKGNSALHIAAKMNEVSCLDALVNLGADKNKYNEARETPLYCAAVEGNLAVVQRLLYHSAQLDLQCGLGSGSSTALYLTCFKGHEKIAECLLDKGADWRIRGPQGWTVLHAACHRNNLAVVKLLLCFDRSLVSLKNDYQSTPLVLAAQEGHDGVVSLLLKEGANINEQNKSGSSALHRAATEGRDTTVRLLLEPQWRGNPDITKNDGATALHMAAFRGHFSIVQYLAERVKDINVLCETYGTPLCAAVISSGVNKRLLFGETTEKWKSIAIFLLKERSAKPNSYGGPYHSPLQAAAGLGDIEMVQLLFCYEAELNAPATGGEHGTPLLAAIREGHEVVVGELLAHGADPNTPYNGCSPLEAAFDSGSEAILDKLLNCHSMPTGEDQPASRKQINVDTNFSDGTTAIWHAQTSDVVDRLVRLGASLASEKPPGRTMLTHAIYKSLDDVIEFLLRPEEPELSSREKLDVDEQDGAGDTALHVTAWSGKSQHIQLAQRLVNELHANVNLQNNLGATPLIKAIREGNAEIQTTLLELGADVAKKDRLGRDALYWACLRLENSPGYTISPRRYIDQMLAEDGETDAKSLSRALWAAVANDKLATAYRLAALLSRMPGNQAANLMGVQDRDGWTLDYLAQQYRQSDFLEDMREFSMAQYSTEEETREKPKPKPPSAWSRTELEYPLQLRDNDLTVFISDKPLIHRVRKSEFPPHCLVIADHCFTGQGKCYFEVRINGPKQPEDDKTWKGDEDKDDEAESSPKNGKVVEIGVGLCREQTSLDDMVGWRSGTWGYHGDDGNLYSEVGWEKAYGDKFGVGSVVGCGVDFDKGGTAYFSLNGKSCGVAATGLTGKLYPAVSFDSTLTGYSVTLILSDDLGGGSKAKMFPSPTTPPASPRRVPRPRLLSPSSSPFGAMPDTIPHEQRERPVLDAPPIRIRAPTQEHSDLVDYDEEREAAESRPRGFARASSSTLSIGNSPDVGADSDWGW